MNKTNNNIPLLEVRHLSIGFKQYTGLLSQSTVTPIRDLNLTVNEKEVVAVVGASGSGKSLLAHSIMGILPKNAVESGGIYYKNNLLTNEDKSSLRKKEIALIPQSVNHLDPLMHVGKQVESLCNKEQSQKKRTAVFSRYNLAKGTENLFPFQLSGGMARRVLISMAVVRGARLILADEPTPGLDGPLVEETLSNLKELAQSGCGVLMITHDIHAALKIADRIYVFLNGTAIDMVQKEDFSGSGERLSHSYTKKLWLSLPQNEFFKKKKDTEKESFSKNSLSPLEAEGISFSYSGGLPLLNNITLRVFPGEIVGLTGPSGQGKSTFAKILSGYIRPQKGKITLSGKSPFHGGFSPVQLIYQHPEKSLNPRWRLRKSLTEAFPEDKAILSHLEINPSWLNRYPHELSGGELQRFCIARILHQKTRFFIADEMTTMLDAIMQAKVWELVFHYAKKYNMGLLIISHEPAILEKLCTRIVNF